VPADHRELTISNDTVHLAALRETVREGIVAAGFPLKLCNRVTIAVDEAITNIIEHAFPDVPRGLGRIRIIQDVSAEAYRIEIVDDGMLHYDPSKHSTVDIEQHVASGKDSGLGIFLIRRIMDQVDYAFDRGKRNHLIMVKRAE
jgi:serine/threonine-protein kinase RsbW